MRNRFYKKAIVCGIITLFIMGMGSNLGGKELKTIKNNFANVSLEPIVRVNDEYNSNTPDYGVKNFSKIQDGIIGVSEGGKVLVHNGTYYEDVYIDKTLELIGWDEDYLWGNDSDGSIIDGVGANYVIHIYEAENVNVTEFIIRNSGQESKDAGIFLDKSKNSHIYYNKIYNNGNGIMTQFTEGITTIEENIINSNNYDGILIDDQSKNVNISFNHIYSCGLTTGKGDGIKIKDDCNGINVKTNVINETMSGISVFRANNIFLENNTIYDCIDNGIFIATAGVKMTYNCIFKNGLNDVEYGAGVLIAHCGTAEDVIIQRNNISENMHNFYIHNSNINYGNFRENNIINEANTGTAVTVVPSSFVFAQHNWWGNENYWDNPKTRMRSLGSILIIFPWSDHEWVCTLP